jgi:hypothetical protein
MRVPDVHVRNEHRWHLGAELLSGNNHVVDDDETDDNGNDNDENHAGSHDDHRGLPGDVPCSGGTKHRVYERHRVSTERFLRRVGCMQRLRFQ